MIFKHFFNPQLAHNSYAVGCPASSEALVIDPLLETEPYLEWAAQEGVRITAVSETHIHADYLSGSRELAGRTGATLYVSDEGDEDWKYQFAGEANVRLVRSGDTLRVGGAILEVVHTPGHTPEHLAFALRDAAEPNEIVGFFSGDFLFVGDVGRPDLLERAAHLTGTMEAGARRLHRSLQDFRRFPDHAQIWPGHGAGSACGKALGGRPFTTLGYEKRTNWAFQIHDEEEFVHQVLVGQPEPPAYFARMKTLNKQGVAATTREVPRTDVLPPRDGHHMILDLRSAQDFRRGHLAGSIHLPWNRNFSRWAGTLLRPHIALTLLGHDSDIRSATQALRAMGFDTVTQWLSPESLLHRPTVPLEALNTSQLDGVTLIDVRSTSERLDQPSPRSLHIPLGQLPDEIERIPQGPLAVHCQGGARSPIAVSYLEWAGFTSVRDVPSGIAALA